MRQMSARDALRVGENVAAHVVAIVVGLILTGIGVGMGITMILIPVGVPVGLIGLGILCWGVWGFGEAKRRQKNAS